jgi:hypothetical protein
MFIINRSPEGAEATATETEVAKSEEVKPTEEESVEEVQSETTENAAGGEQAEEDEGFSSFGEATIQTPQAAKGAEAHKDEGKVVAESQFIELQAKLKEIQTENETLKASLNTPILKAAIEYVAARNNGAEIDPQEFFRETFGLDAMRMSPEEIIREDVKRKAASFRVNLTDDELDESYESEFNKYEAMSRLDKLEYIHKKREEFAEQSRAKIMNLTSEKNEDIQKAKTYWESQRNNFNSKLAEELKQGRKSFGLKVQLTKELLDEINVANDNGCVRFKADGNFDIEHCIETRLFAADPTRYINKLLAAERKKWEKENHQERLKREQSSPDNTEAKVTPTVNNGANKRTMRMEEVKVKVIS